MAVTDDLDVRAVAQRVVRGRERLNLRQAELAKRAGMSEAYINRLENGLVRNPKLAHLIAVAHALEVPLDALLSDPAPDVEQDVQRLIGREPRLLVALASLVRGIQWAEPDDREFVLGHIENLARRFGHKADRP